MTCMPGRASTAGGPPRSWKCPWCAAEPPTGRRGNRGPQYRPPRDWIDKHLQEHVEIVNDDHFGEVVYDDNGGTVVADLNSLIGANMCPESREGLRDAAHALAQREFTEFYVARVLDEDSRLVLAFRAESLSFLGYALVVERTVTYMDGEPTEERHLD